MQITVNGQRRPVRYKGSQHGFYGRQAKHHHHQHNPSIRFQHLSARISKCSASINIIPGAIRRILGILYICFLCYISLSCIITNPVSPWPGCPPPPPQSSERGCVSLKAGSKVTMPRRTLLVIARNWEGWGVDASCISSSGNHWYRMDRVRGPERIIHRCYFPITKPISFSSMLPPTPIILAL